MLTWCATPAEVQCSYIARCTDPEYSSPIWCISAWSAGQEIEDGQAKRSVARLTRVIATFSNFMFRLFPLFKVSQNLRGTTQDRLSPPQKNQGSIIVLRIQMKTPTLQRVTFMF